MAEGSTPYGVPRQILQGQRGRVGVTPGSAVPRIQFSTGMAKVLQDFSFDMFQASGRMEDALDQQAQAEAGVEGAAAGSQPGFELRDYKTLRGRAFNAAGIDTYVATMETRQIEAMAGFHRQFWNDPDGLASASRQYNEGVAAEMDKISPGAGAMYRQRAVTRAQPMIEAARDEHYRMTVDQANAALISSQVALDSEIKTYSADLFSDNPDRSGAAAAALQIVAQEQMKIYNAVDPITGRPLYSETERAKARQDLNDRVFTEATLSWFDAQPDKAEAYTKFMEGDFAFEAVGTGPNFAGMPADVGSAISAASQKYDIDPNHMAAIAKLESGFNPNAKNPNSTASGLFQFIKSTAAQYGLTNPLDPFASADAAGRMMAENSRALANVLGRMPGVGELYLAHQQGIGGATALLRNAGANVIDALSGIYSRERATQAVKLNGGNVNMTAGEFANKWISKAEKAAGQSGATRVEMRRAITPQAQAALDAEMRARIGFANTQRDRAEREEAERIEQEQKFNSFEMTDRLYNGGKPDSNGNIIPPLTRPQILEAVATQSISTSVGEAMIKALAEPPAVQSDREVHTEALRRMYTGEDIYSYVLENKGNLSTEDASSLLSKNQSLNVTAEGGLSPNQKFQYDRLEDLLTPDTMMAQIDPGSEARKFEALDEFRTRVLKEGEDPREVSRDLSMRAARDMENIAGNQLDKLAFPMFAKVIPGSGQIDIQATAQAIGKAHGQGRISDENFARQKTLLRQWATLQERLGRKAATAKGDK